MPGTLLPGQDLKSQLKPSQNEAGQRRKLTLSQSPVAKQNTLDSNGFSCRQEAVTSIEREKAKSDSDSVVSNSTRKALRQHLVETTDPILAGVLATLKNDCVGASESTTCATKFEVPVFDKSIDYVAKVKEQSGVLLQLQHLLEDHSEDYLAMFKEVVRSQKRL